jgi:hypothetical protein
VLNIWGIVPRVTFPKTERSYYIDGTAVRNALVNQPTTPKSRRYPLDVPLSKDIMWSTVDESPEAVSGNGHFQAIAPQRFPSGISQTSAVRSFERAGGVLKKTKRGHAVLKMPNGRLVSLPSGTLKRGLLERQIRVGGLTVDEFLGYLR